MSSDSTPREQVLHLLLKYRDRFDGWIVANQISTLLGMEVESIQKILYGLVRDGQAETLIRTTLRSNTPTYRARV